MTIQGPEAVPIGVFLLGVGIDRADGLPRATALLGAFLTAGGPVAIPSQEQGIRAVHIVPVDGDRFDFRTDGGIAILNGVSMRPNGDGYEIDAGEFTAQVAPITPEEYNRLARELGAPALPE